VVAGLTNEDEEEGGVIRRPRSLQETLHANGGHAYYGRLAHARRRGRLFHHSTSSGAGVRDRPRLVAPPGGGGHGRAPASLGRAGAARTWRADHLKGPEHGGHSLPQLRRVHNRPEAHYASAPISHRSHGTAHQQLLHVYAANRLRAPVGVLVVAGHAEGRSP